MLSVLILWVCRWSINWFDKSLNDTKNRISRSNFLVFSLIYLWSSWAVFLLNGNFLMSSRLPVMVVISYLFWKYSSKSSSETPRSFRKITLRSWCLRNREIHQKRSSLWIVLCLLVEANLFACVIHELEWFVSSVCICENILSRIQCKIDMPYSIFFIGKFNRTPLQKSPFFCENWFDFVLWIPISISTNKIKIV